MIFNLYVFKIYNINRTWETNKQTLNCAVRERRQMGKGAMDGEKESRVLRLKLHTMRLSVGATGCGKFITQECTSQGYNGKLSKSAVTEMTKALFAMDTKLKQGKATSVSS